MSTGVFLAYRVPHYRFRSFKVATSQHEYSPVRFVTFVRSVKTNWPVLASIERPGTRSPGRTLLSIAPRIEQLYERSIILGQV